MLSRNPLFRPFPDRTFDRSVLFGHGRTAAFVFVALLFLFPVTLALAYGLVTFVVAITYSYLTERLGVRRRGERWTMWRWTLDQAILLFLVSVACFLLHNYTVGWSLLNLRVLLYITVPTVLVGLLPIIFSGIAVQLRAEQEYQRVASRVQIGLLTESPVPTSGESVALGGAAGAMVVPGRIVYGVRDGESTALHDLDGESRLIARQLSQVGEELSGSGVIRCHPDYLVNLRHLVAVSANAQGLLLKLRGAEVAVPVPRAYFHVL